MGLAYAALVGTPPQPGTLAFRDWVLAYIAARKANCPLARGTTYYFAASGNDSNPGTQASPMLTASKAFTLINASSGNIACLFNRGDLFTVTGVLQATSIPNVTIADYGTSLNSPNFTAYNKQYGTDWTINSGSYAHRTEATVIGNVRIQKFPLVAFQRLNSAAAVSTTSYSWYQDTGANVLYVNSGPVDPNQSYWLLEACPRNQYSIYFSGCDKSRIQNIRTDGLYCDWTQAGGYSIRFDQNPGEEDVAIGCESYYAGNHIHGQLAVSGNGGYMVWENCKRGYANANGGGGTNFVAYSGGAQESVIYGNEDVFGCLPDYTWYPAASRLGASIFSHGGQALQISMDCEVGNNAYGCATPSLFQDGPVAATLAACRSVVIGERVVGYQPITQFDLAPNTMARVACLYELKPAVNIPSGYSTIANNGWFVRSLARVDMTNQTNNFAFFGQSGPHAIDIEGCHFDLFNCSSGVQLHNGTPATNCPNAVLRNSIFAVRYTYPYLDGVATGVNLPNASANLKGNAYFGPLQRTGTGTPNGYDSDTAKVEMGYAPTPLSNPLPGSPLYRAGVAAGLVIDHDYRFSATNTLLPSIGPMDEGRVLAPAPGPLGLGLTVTDNQDGTGATATITGADPNAAITIYVVDVPSLQQAFFNGFAPAWRSQATRTGNGTATLSVGTGYWWAYATGLRFATNYLSNPVYFQATPNAKSCFERIREAALAKIQALNLAAYVTPGGTLPAISADRVFLQSMLVEYKVTYPCVVIEETDEQEQNQLIMNARDDVGYPLRILILNRDTRNFDQYMPGYLLWRERIMSAFRGQRLPNVVEVYKCDVQPELVISEESLKRNPNYQFVVSGFSIRAWARQQRNL